MDRYTHPLSKVREGEKEHALIVRVQNRSCGDVFTLYVHVAKDGVVRSCSWDGDGCVISVNAVDYFCEWCKGKTFKEIKGCTREIITDLVGVPTIAPAREKCLFLPLSCVFE